MRLLTGLQSRLVFLRVAATIRSGANGRMPPSQSDITLNTSTITDEECEKAGWAARFGNQNKMYVARWKDKLTGKIKYIWFSDTAFLKQNREKEKFEKAETLGKQIKAIEQHIQRNLDSKDEERRKVATVAWLIFAVNMRVGDEKDPTKPIQ